MRTILAAALAALAVAGPAAADELPTRKAGLWESKTMGKDGETVARQCVDASTDKLAQAAAPDACDKTIVTKTAEGYTVATNCKVGDVTAKGGGVITGDFETTVRMETSTTMTGIPGLKEPLTLKTVIENRRLGDCEPGQKPGDIILSDGKVVRTPGADK